MYIHQAAIERVSRYFYEHSEVSYQNAVTYLKMLEIDFSVKPECNGLSELRRISLTFGLTNTIAAVYFCKGDFEARDYWLNKYKELLDY